MPRLLIVDDALTDRVRVAGIAEKWLDCAVLQAENGHSALEKIEHERPDLILTDLQMPEMNGLELVAAVKEEHPHIPVILMTGAGSEQIAAEALRAGAASYVPKNRLAQDLVSILNQVYATSQVAHSQFRLMHYMSAGRVKYVLPNDPGLMRTCVDQVLNMLRCLPLEDESERLRVGIALHEALRNACFHGNLGLTTEESSDPKRFAELVSARSRSEPWGMRRIHVTVDISRESAVFVIQDEGDGFDVRLAGQQNTAEGIENGLGRGMTLMKSIMDEVTFNETGNCVTMSRHAFQYVDGPDDD